MIGIVDYGVGNLFSLESSLKAIGEQVIHIRTPDELGSLDRIILPGVGAFADAAKRLKETGMYDAVKDVAKSGTPILGICLGMQLLFDRSYEFGVHDGLGLIEGEIKPISDRIPASYKVPHIGWNELKIKHHPLFKYISDGECVYFVHSYHADNCNSVIATTDYGAELTAAVAKDNIMGCQFHPEKSGDTGLRILRGFCKI